MNQDKMSWWRAHHGMPSHARWLEIARKSGHSVPVVLSIAVFLMDYASRSGERGSVAGFKAGPCAAFLWIDEEVVTSVVAVMEAVGWISDGKLSSWDERQPLREDPTAAERKRAQRERESAQNGPKPAKSRGGTGQSGNSHDVTHGHEKSPLDKIREDPDKDPVLSNGQASLPDEPIKPDPDADLFRRGREILGKSAGGQIAKLKTHFDGSIPKARAAIEVASTKDIPSEYIAKILTGPQQPRAGPPEKRHTVIQAIEEVKAEFQAWPLQH